MTEMGSEIPEWAMEAAMEALKAARPAYDSQDQYDQHWESVARALVAAERRGIERAAKLMEEGFDRPVATPWSANGASKNDLCPHGMAVYQDCEQCAAAAIRQLGDTP